MEVGAVPAEVEVVVAPEMVVTVDRAEIIDLNNLLVTAVILPHSHTHLLRAHQLTHILMKVHRKCIIFNYFVLFLQFL